ncbi:MAG: nucleoside-diphosphate-sugar epimerase [Candidatus Latescibacterota bacterium]|jgi:nucleoside-diphosphate-sugar epimerase
MYLLKILVIGGTGHIGSYLVPRLVLDGHQVSVVARNPQPQYSDVRLAWQAVEWIQADRRAEEAAGTWLARMQGLEADVVIDLLAFTPEENATMVEAFKGRIDHFLHCGTIWSYGPSARAPYEEHYPRQPITDYGIQKAQIEVDLQQAWRHEGFPATIIHPGHISGRRWLPLDPQGNRAGTEIYEKLASGKKVQLPDLGLYTIHHVHGDDVAQVFQRALNQRESALGQSFNAVAPYALSLVACCQSVAALFGRTAELEFVPLERMVEFVGKENYPTIETHCEHSPCSSIAKSQRLLGYQPRYTTEQIYAECIEYLLESEALKI